MTGQADGLQDFLDKVEPLRKLDVYRSMDLACIAARSGPDWILIAGRALLRTIPCASPKVSIMVDLRSLRAITGRVPVEEVDKLVSNLRDLWVITGLRSQQDSVKLVAGVGQGYSWFKSLIAPTSNPPPTIPSQWKNAIRLFGYGPDLVSIVTGRFLEEVDGQLLRNDPPYNGLSALCGKLGLLIDRHAARSAFELPAELPASIKRADVISAKRSLHLTLSVVGTPELFVEWLPQREAQKAPYYPAVSEDAGECTTEIEIPPGALEAEAKLLFAGLEADRISIRADWENTLLRIGNCFDPKYKRLDDFLFKENNSGANAFELGVARLLSLAGFVVLWFGKASKDALPDLVAYWRSPRGEEVVILGECAIQESARKQPGLAERGKRLISEARLNGAKFVPVLFTRTAVAESELSDAIQLGIAVCDGDKLRRLLGKIDSDIKPLEVFDFLRTMHSQPGGLLGW